MDRRPIWTTSAPVPTFAAASCRSGQVRSGIVAGQSLRVGSVEHREAGRRVEPAASVERVRGVHGQPWREGVSGRLGRCPQPVQGRPGALGVHVVGGDRGHPTPVVDPRVHQRTQLVDVGQVRRCLDVHARVQHDPGHRDRSQVLLRRARRGVPHRGAGLGDEVLHDHLLHVAVPAVALGDGLQRHQAVLLGLADADQDPGGERDRELTRRLEGRQPTCWGLVRRTAMGGQIRSQALDHHSLGGRHRPQRGQRVVADRPGVRVRQQAGLRQHQLAHGAQVVDGRGVPVGLQPGPRLRVAAFGILPQREQGLVAPGGRALLRDRQNLLRGQVGSLHRPR